MTDTVVALQQRADEAAARHDLARARNLLDQIPEADRDFGCWMKMSSLSLALGNAQGALKAVNRALGLAPLDFFALLARARILERLGAPDADEAFGRAVAQRPDTPLPPAMQTAVDHAIERFSAFQRRQDDALAKTVADIAAQADATQRHAIARFRSNMTRLTRVYHSEPTHFHFPGLAEREFHPRVLFPWLEELEGATEAIAAECLSVMEAERAELVPYIQYQEHEPLDQWRPLNQSLDWTAIHLWKNGERVAANADLCPITMALLDRIAQPVVPGCSPNAMFSLLAPHTTIPPHTGVTNTRLLCHLPLVVPKGCWFRVGAETRLWRKGEAFVFDDSIEHEAANPTDQLRIVMIFDLWHPDLAPVEQAAVSRLVGEQGRLTGMVL